LHPEPDADGEAEMGDKFLGHENGIAIRNRKDLVHFLEVDDFRDELVGNALNTVIANFAAGGERG
jgi:hypothetical protein